MILPASTTGIFRVTLMSDSTVSPRNTNRLTLFVGTMIGSGLARPYQAVALWWRIRRDERFLLGQPHYLLKDIGIERADIASAVRNRQRP